MVRAFYTLLADLMIALNFIEPDDANLAISSLNRIEFEEDEYNIKYQESYEFEKYPFSLKT